MNWTIFGPVLGTAIVGVLGLIGVIVTTRKDKSTAQEANSSATMQKTAELAITDLINQYREVNEELRDANHELEAKIQQLQTASVEDKRLCEAEKRALREKVERLESEREELEAEIIRRKYEAGEFDG